MRPRFHLRPRRIVGLLALLALLAMGLSALGIQSPLGASGPSLPGVRVSGLATLVRPGQTAPLGELAFLAVEPSGNLVVTDRARRSVLRFDAAGQLLSEWGPSLGALTIAEPAGVAVQGDRYYLIDRGQPRLLTLDARGTLLGVVDLEPFQPYGLNGLAADGAGNLYLADTGRNRLLIFTTGGSFVRQVGSGGSNLGQFTQPMALAFAPDGSLFIADWENGRIQHWDRSLVPVAAWPTGVRPFGVAIDPIGRVYVPDADRARVQVYTPNGSPLGELGGPAAPIDVDAPRQVAAAPPGTPSVYVLGRDGVVRVDLESVAPPPQGQGLDLVGLALLGLLAGGLALAVGTYLQRRQAQRRQAVGAGQPTPTSSVEVAPLDRPVGLGAENSAQR